LFAFLGGATVYCQPRSGGRTLSKTAHVVLFSVLGISSSFSALTRSVWWQEWPLTWKNSRVINLQKLFRGRSM